MLFIGRGAKIPEIGSHDGRPPELRISYLEMLTDCEASILEDRHGLDNLGDGVNERAVVGAPDVQVEDAAGLKLLDHWLDDERE